MSYKLIHNDCDGYPSSWGEWEKSPSADDIVSALSAYSWTEDEIHDAANELICTGEAHMNDSCNTNFMLV